MPKDKKVTYTTFACDHRQLKEEKFGIHKVFGGDKLDYKFDSGSPARNMLDTKLLLNRLISDAQKRARFCSTDLKDIFLHTPMDNPEYMKVPYKYVPPNIRKNKI